MDIQIWLAFMAASVALLLVPGPTVLLVFSYALSQGRRVAFATVAGVALGDFIAMSASLAGLGALILASATLFTTLKWIGALYLIWLGIKMFRSASGPSKNSIAATSNCLKLSPANIFFHATAVTALNPKSIIFFIAFVPQFMDTESALGPQFSILVASFMGLATINALVYALLADKLRLQISNPRIVPILSKFGSAVLIAMGVSAAALKR